MNPEVSLLYPTLVLLLGAGIALACALISLYGVYLSFSKKWYIGAVALFIHPFAFIVGAAKLFFKKDLLK